MAETPHAQQDIAYIRTHVEQLEQMLAFEMRSNPAARAQALEILKRRPGTAALYLALGEGPVTQQELTKCLELDKSKVSVICRELVGAGFVAEIRSPTRAQQRAYTWTPFEKYLSLSKLARMAQREATAAKTPSLPSPHGETNDVPTVEIDLDLVQDVSPEEDSGDT